VLTDVPVQLSLHVRLVDWVGPVLDMVATNETVSVGVELTDRDALHEE